MQRGLIGAALATALSLFTALALVGGAGGQDAAPAEVKIAFIGDQGLGPDAQAVLQLIEDEGADAVIHSGDFDYHDDPRAWNDQINAILGEDFPYFASIGNHDIFDFFGSGGYQAHLEARMKRLGIPWDGELGVRSSHYFRGIFIVLTAPGIFGPFETFDDEYDEFIEDRLAKDASIWRISSWHKNMRAMQVGGKLDETGWRVYEKSRKGGAIIATAHEHSYSRTHLLSSFRDKLVASRDNLLVLSQDDPRSEADEGRSFAFVSGLGGRSIRGQSRSGPWWASIYTAKQQANHGALFGTFNHGGSARLAHFYFKDIDGTVADEFFVWSNVGRTACGLGVELVPLLILLEWKRRRLAGRDQPARAPGDERTLGA